MYLDGYLVVLVYVHRKKLCQAKLLIHTILYFKNYVHVNAVIEKKETLRLTLYQGSPKEKMKKSIEITIKTGE